MWLIIVLVVLVILLLVTNIRVVPQATEFVIERLGTYYTTWETGLHFKVPLVDRVAKRISLKEQVMDFAPQPVITEDNVTMQIDTIVFYQVTDAKLYTYGVERPILAIESLTATTLRNIIGDMELDHTLTSRDVINSRITAALDQATDKWGIKVNRVELKNIVPPRDIQDAMEKQMRAERERREAILRAEGEKRSQILIAEGKKESQILNAEAEKQAAILLAEAEKEKKIREGQGEAESIMLVQKAAARTDGLSGLESGFHALDKMTSGWQNSDLVIIAARPAMGKTAFVLSMAKNMAVNAKIPVALFSLEMANVQLVNRLIVNVCEIPGEKIKSGQLAPYEWGQLDYKIKELYDAPLYVDDTPSLSVFELRTKARRLVREHGVKIIIIDYLQLMNASGMSFGSRQEEVSTISRSLKGLAKELNIPIIALSQLNRGVESREGIDGKRPQLSDLRESGAIEQDADMVCFIHRPEYYKIFQDEKGNDLHGMAEIIIAKHRNGAVGDVLLRFRGEFARFQNPDDEMIIPLPGEEPGIIRSKMNGGGSSVPPPPHDAAHADNNPFGAPIPEGPLPF